MYEYIQGKLSSLNPTAAVIETGGIGYQILISLQTFSQIQKMEEVKLWIHYVVREDVALLYGFYTTYEREIFRRLINVSGVGPNTARMILSALDAAEVRQALLSEDIDKLKSIKGIGLKTAQRMVVELKDKMLKIDDNDTAFVQTGDAGFQSTPVKEAESALVLLGFQKAAVEKVLRKIIGENPRADLEDLIKMALKCL